ncbi:MAG: DUF3325 domain-containing protein [Erythrobacter sp.]
MLVLMVFALMSNFCGCALLALSQARHWQAVSQSAASPPRALRKAGWGFLLASLVFCIARDGPSFAILFWPLLAMLSALGVASLLTWRPTILRPLAWLLRLPDTRR